MLRFDLSNEDVGDDFVGALLVFSNTILPRGALAVGILWDAAQAVLAGSEGLAELALAPVVSTAPPPWR